MKKIFLLFCIIALAAGCAIDDGPDHNFHVEFVPVENVELPESMTPGNNYEITVQFRRPNDCYYFDGFYYQADNDVRIVAVQALYIEDANCAPILSEEPQSESFILQCPANYAFDAYHFKFYQGEDAQGNQVYLEREVPISY